MQLKTITLKVEPLKIGEIIIDGTFIKYLSGKGACKITTDQGSNFLMFVGDYVVIDKFAKIYVENLLDVSDTKKFTCGTGFIKSDHNNSNITENTLNTFLGGYQLLDVALLYPHICLFNETNSTINIKLKDISASTLSPTIKAIDTFWITDITGFTLDTDTTINKYLGEGLPIGSGVYYFNSETLLGTHVQESWQNVNNNHVSFLHSDSIIIPSGFGYGIRGEEKQLSLSVAFEWEQLQL